MSRRLLVAAAVLGAFAWAPAPAGAHAVLTSSQPADAASLDGAPRHVTLRFNEAISTRFQLVRLLDGRGRVVAGTRLRAGEGTRTLIVDVPRLARGTYEVTWQVLAQDDGHVTGGAIVFGVGVPAGAAPRPAPDAAPSTLEAGLRWLDFALYALVVGGLAVGLLLLGEKSASRAPGWPPPVAAGRVLAGVAWSGALALALGPALLVRQAATLPTEGSLLDAVGGLLGARWGVLWLVREALLVAVVVAATRSLRAPRPAYAVAAAAVVALAVVRALGGHGAAVAAPTVHVAADAIHVLAAAVWMGGVVALAIALWPSGAMSRAQAVALARAVRRRFAWVAGVSVALVAATGLYSAGAQVASIDALLTTGYGQELLVKTALVVVAGALGLTSARLLRSGSRRAGRLMLAEGAVGLGILLAAAEMTATSPPRGPEFDAPKPVRPPALAARIDDVVVSATARPNRPGTNVISLLAVSSRRPPPAAIDRVTAFVSGPDAERAPRAVELAPLGAGRWSGGVRLAEPGGWRLTVAIDRGGRRLTTTLPWTVTPPDTARPVSVSARRLAPILDRTAALVALALVAGAVALGAGRLRRPIDPLRREAT